MGMYHQQIAKNNWMSNFATTKKPHKECMLFDNVKLTGSVSFSVAMIWLKILNSRPNLQMPEYRPQHPFYVNLHTIFDFFKRKISFNYFDSMIYCDKHFFCANQLWVFSVWIENRLEVFKLMTVHNAVTSTGNIDSVRFTAFALFDLIFIFMSFW